jgi:DNA topoisomerase I
MQNLPVDGTSQTQRGLGDRSGGEATRNTKTVCRKCYVHPEIVNAYMDGTLLQSLCRRVKSDLARSCRDLPRDELAVLTCLHARLNGDGRRRRDAKVARAFF